MAGPFDYTIDVKSPFENIAQGYQLGAGMLQARQAQEDRALALQQRQAEMERQKLIQQEIDDYRANPTVEGVNSLSAILPHEQAKSIREGWGALDSSVQQKRLSLSMQVAAALRKNPDVAFSMLEDMSVGEKDPAMSKAYADAAKLAKLDPSAAFLKISAVVSALPEGKAALEALLRAEKQPAEVMEAEAKAETAGVTAKYADTKALLELDEIKNDMQVKRVNSQLYAMTAAAAREANELKRQELWLKIEEKRNELDQIVRDKASKAASGLEKLDRTLSTIDRIESFDKDVLDNVLGPIDSRVPTLRQDSADLEQLIDQLGSQAFLSAVAEAGTMAGMTETEGAKLQASAAQLSKSQSAKQFRDNLTAFKAMLNKAKANISGKYGAVTANQPIVVDY